MSKVTPNQLYSLADVLQYPRGIGRTKAIVEAADKIDGIVVFHTAEAMHSLAGKKASYLSFATSFKGMGEAVFLDHEATARVLRDAAGEINRQNERIEAARKELHVIYDGIVEAGICRTEDLDRVFAILKGERDE